ncbi:MAG: carotenoid biosynthesis protein [Nitrospiraceae bacterium]
MDLLIILTKTIVLQPYVFLFLAVSLLSATRLLGWRRTGLFFSITWGTGFLCEWSSSRTGIPFGRYHYTGATVSQELYLSNIPFMAPLSYTFLLYASYCLALFFFLPLRNQGDHHSIKTPELVMDSRTRISRPVLWLTTCFFVLIDVVIDPVALRGDRWFLGRIYYYSDPGIHFGVPLANYFGWAVVGLIALTVYDLLNRRLAPQTWSRFDSATGMILLGCAL